MNGRKIVILVIALLEWFPVIAQFILQQQNSTAGTAESLTRFFSFFTILTNILVAVYVTVHLLARIERQAGFFFRPSFQTATALYITIVGLIYNILLRHLWAPEGLQVPIDELLHTVIPVLVLIYWWIWVDTRKLRFGVNCSMLIVVFVLFSLFFVILGKRKNYHA